jgi:hypothetical protein
MSRGEIKQNEVFEVFGVYFANCYWNSLYDAALNIWHQDQLETLDEAYRVAVKRYNMAFCKKTNPDEKINQNYVKIIKDVYRNYKEYLGASDTYFGFIDTVVKFLIPSDFYKNMTNHDDRKDGIFRDILSKTLTRFTLFVSQEGLKDVVDAKTRKNAQEHVQAWKKKFIELLNQERNNFCSLLLAKNSGVDIRDPDEIPSIPKQVLDKLSDRLKSLIIKKSEMERERNQYAKLAKTYKGLLSNQEKMLADKDAKIAELEAALKKKRSRWATATPASASVPAPAPNIISVPENSVIQEAPAPAPRIPREEAGRPTDSQVQKAMENENDDALQAIEDAEFSGEEISEEDVPDIADKNEEFEVEGEGDLEADE